MIILYGRVDIGTLVETAKRGIRSLKLVGVKRLFHNSFLSYFFLLYYSIDALLISSFHSHVF